MKINLFKTKELKNAYWKLQKINKLEPEIQALSDKQLKAKTAEFKKRLSKNETLEDITVEAFAVAREATYRVLGKRPFDVQIIGGLVLIQGSVAEMKTGEGKTIASIAPVYLNALSGEGVIVSTVNEYLTERDAEETGQVHNFLGLTVGVNLSTMQPEQKRDAYGADITYSVHSEIGFDYLRDNMVKRLEEKVQRGFNFALIDEVDSILIDEARTPLIVSGGQTTSSGIYAASNQFVKTLKKDDYEIDLESKTIQLDEKGMEKAAKFFGVKNIFEMQNSEIVHRIQNALRANYIMAKDADYIVVEGKIMIVDAFTGRVMEGRSFSDGLHQAIQAKENVEIDPETKTMATITYQNLFRMFKRLSGMTGTGKSEEDEFIEIYNMRVNVIPTNMPIVRKDEPPLIFNNSENKYKAIVKDIKGRYEKGQPVLIGTEEVSESEKISQLLLKAKIPHTILNAKQNEQEAEIISKAGQEKSITIATNMAGRGTDIKPSKKSLELGGLYVLGTNYSESIRIDNQLKGRSGRQGDVGESRFYLSLDDKLISRFSNQPKLKKAFAKHGPTPIKQTSVAKAMRRAQIKIEGFNFDARKNVLQYDDVIRQQRDLIYAQRDIIIGENDLQVVITRMLKSVVNDLIHDKSFKAIRFSDGHIDPEKASYILNKVWFSVNGPKINVQDIKGKSEEEVIEVLSSIVEQGFFDLRDNIVNNISSDFLNEIERNIVLTTFDQNWQLHIDKMTKLRTSSSMASYAQKNPYQEYVDKGAEFFEELLRRISHNTTKLIMQNQYGKMYIEPVEEFFDGNQTIVKTDEIPMAVKKKTEERNQAVEKLSQDPKPKTPTTKKKAVKESPTKKASSKKPTTKKSSSKKPATKTSTIKKPDSKKKNDKKPTSKK